MGATTRYRGAVASTATILALLAGQLRAEPLPLFPVRDVWASPLSAVLAAPPAFGDTRAYLPLDGEGIVAYDLVQGERLWTVPLHTRAKPAIGDDRVFLIVSSELVSIHAADGRTAWRIPFPEPLAAPIVWENGWLILATISGVVMAFRSEDGELIWRRDLTSRASAPPTLAAERVYVPTEDRRLVALHVLTGEPMWERRLGGTPREVLAVATRLYTGSTDNFFYCVNADTGEILWRWRTGADVIGMPAVDDQRVYFVSLDNVLRALDRSHGAERWHRALPIRPSSGPVAAGDALLVSGVGPSVYGFRRQTGEPAGNIAEKTGELTAPPHVINGPFAPIVIVARYDVVDGPELRALTRQVDPIVEPLAPLPNPTPVDLPRFGTSPASPPVSDPGVRSDPVPRPSGNAPGPAR